jgi:hypothetical protein
MNPVRFDQRQRRISERLSRLVGPGAAAFFRDACRHMEDPTRFESTSHQVAHLVREVESSLRSVVGVVAGRYRTADSKSSERSFFRPILERLDRLLHRMLDSVDEGTRDRQEDLDRPGHADEVREILTALDIPVRGVIGQKWLQYTGKLGFHARAHRRHLSAPRPTGAEFEQFWLDAQSILDAVLEQFEKRFVEVQEIIDVLLATEHPTRRDVALLRERIPNNPIGQGRFFENLAHSGWLGPLRKAKFLSDPPEAEHDEAGAPLSSPPWPAGQYLARMAKVSSVQKVVFEILVDLPETQHVYVHEILAEAALGLKPTLAVRLVPKLVAGLSRSPRGLFRQKVGDLIVAFATGGQAGGAFDLASKLFALHPADDGRSVAQGHARSALDDYEYQQLLGKCRPSLMRADNMKTIALLCGFLDHALGITADSPQDDHSPVWRQAIEDDSDDRPWSVQGTLVSAIRDCVREILSMDPSAAVPLISMLEARAHPVYRRLALDSLAQSPERHLDLVEPRVLETSRWDTTERHEYATLARCAFPHVSNETRAAFLAWIDAGPDLESLATRWAEIHGARPLPEELDRHRRVWQRDRLAPLKDVLPSEWKARYQALVAAEGEPDHPDFPLYSRSWSGPTSPTSAQELGAMPIDRLAEHLRTWTPVSDWMSPSMEGLARELASAVATDASRFAASAASFKGLDVTYVRSVLGGMRDALKAGKVFDWSPVLELAAWVVFQPRSVTDVERASRDRDPHWGWARKTVADLLQSGFHSKTCEIPIESKEVVWSILSPILDDPDPRPEDEAKYGGSNMDPATMSINTTRGEALHAAIDYGIWIDRHEPSASPRDLSRAPELRSVLDRHLVVAVDPSTTARGVYGWRLPALCYLDPAWVAANRSRIFPVEAEDAERSKAAWESYLGFNAPGAYSWPLLADEYRRAVESLQQGRKSPSRKSLGGDPLVQHVMVLYWHGLQGLEKGSLVARFFELAAEDLRHEALDWIGRTLQGKDDVPAEVIERVKALWDFRLRAGLDDSAAHAKELAAFAWWVKAERLDLDWRLAQLLKVLKSVGSVDPAFVAVEALAAAALTRPTQAVNCLAAMLNAEGNRWEPTMWSQEARTLLTRALESGEAEAVTAARELISVLEARGYPGYRDLLSKKVA